MIFLSTKLLYHKDGGTRFYHMVQSHPKGAEIDPVTAHAAAMKLAEYFVGREVLVCTHVDRDHIHSHFIINSVSLEDGRKLHIAELQLQELRRRNDDICMQFGLPVFQQGQRRKKVKAMSTAEYHAAAKGGSWKFRLMNTIDDCMCYAHTREEFITLMRSEGYDVRWEKSRPNITYTISSGYRCRDDRLHDEKYLKEAMEREFRIRQRILSGGIETAEPAGDASSATGTSDAHTVSGGTSDTGGVVDLLTRFSALYRVTTVQNSLLERIASKPTTYATREQAEEMVKQLTLIRTALERAGRKKKRRFSLRLPKLQLPRLSPALLLIPAILLAFWAAWSSWDTLWSAIKTLLP